MEEDTTMARRSLIGVVALAALLHTIGIAQSVLPAQDGLKFLRFARQFQNQPWVDAIRIADQHPLYPASIALVQPLVAFVLGPGPDAWRIAAQSVSTLASIALIFPLLGLARALFDEKVASLCVLL